MQQSTFDGPDGIHAAIIMDGSGRWAQARGLSRSAGHCAGATAVRRVVAAAPSQRIDVLTLYAFSADNWKRPAAEVRALLRVLESYLRTELATCVEHGVRVEVLGRRDRVPAHLRAAIEAAERATAAGTALRLRLAIDYSSREAILRAAAQARRSSNAEFARHLEPDCGRTAPDVDLLIRTGGEQRLSDFLLWESAYAELYFTAMAWPDFDGAALAAAVAEFGRRQRRFGGPGAVSQAVAS